MGIFRRTSNNDNEADNNIFWVTMSDLMLGLAIIFISMFVVSITGFTQDSMKQKQAQKDVSEEISRQLHEMKIEATVDKMTGDLKIPAVELFEVNSYVLTPRGKQLLDKIAPVYINTIFSNKELSGQIENIIVQGHTDSQMFKGVTSQDQQFLRNMNLSLQRANSVAEHMFHTGYNKSYHDDFRKKLVVEGKSYNEPIYTNGHEDYAKSRRVELKLKVKTLEVSRMLGIKK